MSLRKQTQADWIGPHFGSTDLLEILFVFLQTLSNLVIFLDSILTWEKEKDLNRQHHILDGWPDFSN
jgi:hypothetical protein